jgi:hypothetical protein
MISISNRILGPDRFLVLLGMHVMNQLMNDARVTKRVRGVTVHEEFDSITQVSTTINKQEELLPMLTEF